MMEQIQAILKGLMALCMLVIVGILVYAMNATCATTSVDHIGEKFIGWFYLREILWGTLQYRTQSDLLDIFAIISQIGCSTME